MVLRRPETSATNSFFLNLFNVFLSKKYVFMSCHANVCTIELYVYASFCYKHISIWRKFARIQLKCSICVSK